ncbi:MAG: alpha/beta hydrolase [Actinobacteria bacterium]|nr:alpha/beta hydrolase [Actinomycetota bacterium]
MQEGRWLERPWGRMRIWESGSGPTTVAIHGLGGSGRYFGGLSDELDGKLIAPDLAGFGSSDVPSVHADRTLHLSDLDAVLPSDEPLSVIGFSAGAGLAALWAARNPTRVRSLVLAGAPFPGDGNMDYREQAESATPKTIRLVVHALQPIWPLLSRPIAAATKFPREIVEDFGKQSIPARAWTLWSAISDPEVVGELAPLQTIGSRVLLINSSDDHIVPLRNQDRWAQFFDPAVDVTRMTLGRGEHQFLLRGGSDAVADWLSAG